MNSMLYLYSARNNTFHCMLIHVTIINQILKIKSFSPDGRMSRVHGVLNYAGCFAEVAGSVDRVNGWEAGLRDGLGYIHDLL